MEKFTGTKDVMAKAMTLGEYNALRGLTMPENEDPNTKGYLVEYLDSPNKNHPDFENYISWSPKDVFEKSYSKTGTPLERLVLEETELGEKLFLLGKAMNSDGFVDKVGKYQFDLLFAQQTAMSTYRQILRMRIENLQST